MAPVAPAQRPRVLVVTTNRWGSDFTLLRALRDAGAAAAMLCPTGHPVRAARSDGFFILDLFRSGRSLSRAIDAFSPDVLVPGDERARRFMQALHDRGGTRERRLIRASLGPPDGYDVMMSRRRSMEAVEAAGIPAPDLIADTSRASLVARLRVEPFGIVLKADGTWSGDGVRVCRTVGEIDAALADLRPGKLLRALKRRLVNRDAAPLADWLFGPAPSLSAQSCLPDGRVGDVAVFCHEGTVLGLTCAEREAGIGEHGPSTIVRIVDRPALADGVRRFVADLRLSGFIGFDFMVDPQTDVAHVIEVNPRATALAGIHPRRGPSPAAAAASLLGGVPVAEAAPHRELVAYFPKAWQTHPDDLRLALCQADMPADEPLLIEALLGPPWVDRGRRARLWRKVRHLVGRQRDRVLGTRPIAPA